MNKPSIGFPEILERSRPLRVGFIPLSDCAPIVVARESGLFDKYELRVELQRETKWANIRDRIIYGDLDAAHAPATLPFVTNLGLDSDQCASVAGMILSLQGNAITLSRELWTAGVRDAETLREEIYRHWRKRTFTFAVVFPYSTQYFLLRRWLKAGGILPHVEIRIVVLPPSQMFPTLKLGYIDGFCAGEPWTSLAAEAGIGATLATSSELAPLHPEKVLMVRRDFAVEHATEHERLLAALLEACAFCDQPENRPLLGEILAQPHYVNVPAECIRAGLKDDEARDPASLRVPGSNVFHRHNANDPTDDRARWVVDLLYELMEERVLQTPPFGRAPVLRNVFRRDLFERAKTAMAHQTHTLKAEAESYHAGAA